MNEIVIAHYKEDISWVPKTNWKVTVYNKHEGDNLLPNVGREGHTYLHHIVTNYDKLADWTLFTQGSVSEHPGYNGDNAFVSVSHVIMSDDVSFVSGYIPLVQTCLPISFYINHLDILKVASSIGLSAHELLEYFFPNGIFMVDKATIHKRPKEFYEKCLSLLSTEINPIAGHVFERLWVTIFNSIPVIHTDLEIISAKFGTDGRWVDVRDQIRYMCALKNGMSVRNIGWGVADPAPYVVKETHITYHNKDGTYTVSCRDNEFVNVNGVENIAAKPISYFVNLIRNAPIEDIKDVKKLEELICKCGLSNDGYMMRELLPQYLQFTGYGLHIQQNPKEFAEYLLKVSELSIKKYMEIGVRFAGTFIFTTEYLSRISGVVESVAIDLAKQTIHDEYSLINSDCQFLYMDSLSTVFSSFVSERKFDLVLIDGDHSYRGVSSDYNTICKLSKFCSFHDIVNISCPDVSVFWNSIKKHSDGYWEFTHNTHLNDNYRSHFGLGLLSLARQCDGSTIIQ
jgi:hypothetical protein